MYTLNSIRAKLDLKLWQLRPVGSHIKKSVPPTPLVRITIKAWTERTVSKERYQYRNFSQVAFSNFSPSPLFPLNYFRHKILRLSCLFVSATSILSLSIFGNGITMSNFLGMAPQEFLYRQERETEISVRCSARYTVDPLFVPILSRFPSLPPSSLSLSLSPPYIYLSLSSLHPILPSPPSHVVYYTTSQPLPLLLPPLSLYIYMCVLFPL